VGRVSGMLSYDGVRSWNVHKKWGAMSTRHDGAANGPRRWCLREERMMCWGESKDLWLSGEDEACYRCRCGSGGEDDLAITTERNSQHSDRRVSLSIVTTAVMRTMGGALF
jgi:hypothetical protein